MVRAMKKHEAFCIGVGVGYILEKYDGDVWDGLKRWYSLKRVIAEKQRRAEIERARVVDVFGDEIR